MPDGESLVKPAGDPWLFWFTVAAKPTGRIPINQKHEAEVSWRTFLSTPISHLRLRIDFLMSNKKVHYQIFFLSLSSMIKNKCLAAKIRRKFNFQKYFQLKRENLPSGMMDTAMLKKRITVMQFILKSGNWVFK
jgi:hypothetical protein